MDRLREQIDAQMSSPGSEIVSVADDDADNALHVGMTDPTGPESTALKAQYGDAIVIEQEDPIEPLSDETDPDAVPGADTFRDPMLAGVRIYPPNREGGVGSCTAGFMFKGRRTDAHPENSLYEGVISAGHCFVDAGDPPLTIWRQGGQDVGPWATHRFVNNTYADAGTINTGGGTGHFRDISNKVFVGENKSTVAITRVAAPSSGKDGDAACISGAYGGYSCGTIDKTGHGRTASGLHRGYDVELDGRQIRNVYRMRRDSGSCKDGDSGAPVFKLNGTAMGIAFASERRGQSCVFSQEPWVEYELNVKTYTGDD